MGECDLGKLADMEYPGRCILLKSGSGRGIAVYGITGRSSSSQARKFVKDMDRICVKPTDEETLKQGNADLLIYDNMIWNKDVLAVSNGKQTNTIFDEVKANLTRPYDSLMKALKKWDYEDDPPSYTPRIFGVLVKGGAWLGMVSKYEDGGVLRSGFPVDGGMGITTYEGANKDPLPAYTSRPFPVKLEGNAHEIAKEVWEGITKEFRVSVGVLVRKMGTGLVETCIINKNE